MDDERPEFGQDGSLRPEDGVDGLHGDAGFLSDRPERRRGVSILEQAVARGVEDAVSGDRRTLLAQRRASGRRFTVDRKHMDRVSLHYIRVPLYRRSVPWQPSTSPTAFAASWRTGLDEGMRASSRPTSRLTWWSTSAAT